MTITRLTVPSKNKSLDASPATFSIRSKCAWMTLCVVALLVSACGQPRLEAIPETGTTLSFLGVVIDSGHSLSISAGELATTVVPPGLKSECPAGRLLISNDSVKIGGNTSASPGDVRGFDLDELGVLATTANVEKLNTITDPPVP